LRTEGGQPDLRRLPKGNFVLSLKNKSSEDLCQMNEHLSPISIVRQLHQRDLFYFTPRMLSDLLTLDLVSIYYLVARLKADGLIAEVEKGKYLLLGFEPERVLSNPLFIASHLVTPAYVSYWSALHFYGFTEQVPLTTFVATTKKKRPAEFRGFRFRFVTIQPRKFFGYRREAVGGLPVLIADEAKALETLGQPGEGLTCSESLVKLDPARPRSGRYVPRWRVVVNVPEVELQPIGVG